MPDPLDAPHAPFPPDPGFRGAIPTPAGPMHDTPRPPRPPRPRTPIGVVLFAMLALGSAILWQNLPESVQRRVLFLPPIVEPTPLPFDIADPVAMQAKIYILVGHELGAEGESFLAQAQRAVDTAAASPVPSPGGEMVGAIVAGDLSGPDAALERLAKVEDHLDELDAKAASDTPKPGRATRYADYQQRLRDGIREDLPAFRALYEIGPGALSDVERSRLTDRYGYTGRLALTWSLDETDPAWQAVHAGGMTWRLVVLVLWLLIALGAIFAGFVILVLAIVKLGSGTLRPRAPAPPAPGGVLLETVAIFATCFLAMSVGVQVLAEYAPNLAILQLPLQWSLLVIPLWPLLRGWRAADWRRALGLHADRGFFREVLAGFVGYLAAVPLFTLGAITTFVVMMLDQAIFGPSPAPPSNPIVDILVHADWVTVLLIGSLACVWAPLCEELIFRGALFAHLRSRWGVVLAIIVSGLVFAYLHSYGPLMLWPIIALGVSFATIRWWRGSIIACMTAHAIHNTTLTAMMLVLVGIFPT
ncbi:MAG: type II CAAX endopeptidase family protein [Phycisphaerales bacterium]